MKHGSSLALAIALSSVSFPAIAAPPAAPAAVTPMTPDVVASYDRIRPEADYVKRVEMVPMRDGVKLYTVIVMKKGTKNGPILLSRTPYDAKGSVSRTVSREDHRDPAGDGRRIRRGRLYPRLPLRTFAGSTIPEGEFILTRADHRPAQPHRGR